MKPLSTMKQKKSFSSFKTYYWLLKLPNLLTFHKRNQTGFYFLQNKLHYRIDIFLFQTAFFSSLKEVRLLLQTKNWVLVNGTCLGLKNIYLKPQDFVAFQPTSLKLLLENWKLNKSFHNFSQKKAEWKKSSGWASELKKRERVVLFGYKEKLSLRQTALKSSFICIEPLKRNNFILDLPSCSLIVF